MKKVFGHSYKGQNRYREARKSQGHSGSLVNSGEHTLDYRTINDTSGMGIQPEQVPAQRRLRVVTLRKTTPLKGLNQNSNFRQHIFLVENGWVNEEDGTPFSQASE